MKAIVLIACLLLVVPAQAATLYFVGDGRDILLAEATAGGDYVWPMSLDGHGGDASSFEQAGPQDESAAGSTHLPTFVWDQPVSIGAQESVIVHMYVEDPWGGICGGMDGQIFDEGGNVLGPAGGLTVDTAGGTGTVEELVFAFEGIAGDFGGLQFQIGGHWTDCSSLPYTFHWGADDVAAMLIYAEPVATVNSTTHHIDLEDDVAQVSHQFSATDDVYIFNWTSSSDALNLTINATVVGGSAAVSITDLEGYEVYGTVLDANTTAIEALSQPAGDLQISVNYTAFSGSLSLSLAGPPAPEPEHNETAPPGNMTSEPEGNETMEPIGEDSPALPLMMVVVGLVVLARRRR